MKEALVYLLAVTIAEAVTIAVGPLWGIVSHILVLVTVILRSASVHGQARQQLLLSLTLAPLIRIISLSMPLVDVPRIWWYPIIYAPLLVGALAVVRILNLRTRDIGLSFGLFLPLQLAVALSGFVIGVTEYFILRPEPMSIELTWQGVWLPALVLLVCTGFVEEFIFRGVMQYTALRVIGRWGIVYVSLIFAVLHMGFLSWIDVIFVFSVALFFSWVVKRTGSLLGVTLAHGIANIVLFVVAPLL